MNNPFFGELLKQQQVLDEVEREDALRNANAPEADSKQIDPYLPFEVNPMQQDDRTNVERMSDNMKSPLMVSPEYLGKLDRDGMSVQQPEVAPVIAEASTPPMQEQKVQTRDDLNAPSDSEPPQTPMSPQEKMMAEYKAMQDADRKALEEARSSDRNLKMGGAIGDALATFVNARGQMNVKAPGVQVQQGAGLGKIADMFATAPDVASDIKSRREDLLAQYKSLGGSQRHELKQLQEPGGKIGLYRINSSTGEKERVGDAPLRMQIRQNALTGLPEFFNPLTPESIAPKQAEIQGEIKADTKSTIKSLDPKQKEQVEKARADFNKSAKDEIDKVNNISQLSRTLEMAKDNKAAANSFGTELAKVYQDGRLSDKDVDLYVKDKQLLQKFRTGYFDAVEGTIDPNKIPEYRELIKALNQGASEALMGKADIFAQQRLSSFIDDPNIAREVVFPINTITKMPNTQQVQVKKQQTEVNPDAYERAIQRAMADNPTRTREQIEAAIKSRK